MCSLGFDIPNIDSAFITYNYLPNGIEELRWKQLEFINTTRTDSKEKGRIEE